MLTLFAKMQIFHKMKFDLIITLTYILLDTFCPCLNVMNKCDQNRLYIYKFKALYQSIDTPIKKFKLFSFKVVP